MSRLSALAAHPRRTLGALAVVLAAVGITVGSGADFTAQSANPANTFTTGTLTTSNSSPGAAILTPATMKPGDTTSGTVDIKNTGSLAGKFNLTSAIPATAGLDPTLLGQINLTVVDCGLVTVAGSTCTGTAVVYSGTADKVNQAASAVGGKLPLGTFAAGDMRRYKFTAALPTTVSDAFQGKTAKVDFTWDATTN